MNSDSIAQPTENMNSDSMLERMENMGSDSTFKPIEKIEASWISRLSKNISTNSFCGTIKNIDMKSVQTKDIDYSEFECPVCYKMLTIPIYQCFEGHTVCNSCRAKLKSCPMCRSSIKISYRNSHMEDILGRIPIPCEYKSLGCTKMMRLVNRRAHESRCYFRGYDCPLNFLKCFYTGKPKDIMDHLAEEHPGQQLVYEPVARLIIPKWLQTPQKTYHMFIYAFNNFFHISLTKKIRRRYFIISVSSTIFSTIKESRKYKIKFLVSSLSKQMKYEIIPEHYSFFKLPRVPRELFKFCEYKTNSKSQSKFIMNVKIMNIEEESRNTNEDQSYA